jgi:hypothetical protein
MKRGDQSMMDETGRQIGVAGDRDFVRDPSLGVALPIVFDFDADGAGLVALADSKTRYDMNGDGVADRTGWIEPGDALLALDRNENGTIDGIGEISFVKDMRGATSDLQGLAAYDTNGDGILDAQDDQFAAFRLWFDRNSDGKTDAGELLSLAQAGVASIDLHGEATGQAANPGDNIVYNKGNATLSSGGSLAFQDVGFAYQALSAVEFQTSDWGAKARRNRIVSSAGQSHVTPASPKGILDSSTGLIGPAALLAFSDRNIGTLSAILLDLDRDGLEARRYDKTRALFDMDGDGVRDDTGWVSGGDGMLVIDRDGDGQITSPAEISFLSEQEGLKSAWVGLSLLDTSKDGNLSSADTRFGELRIWVDRNANGVTDAGELQALADWNITEISLTSTPVDASVKPGSNLPLATAIFTRGDGVTGTIGSVALGFTPSRAPHDTGAFGVSNDIYAAGSAAAQLAQAISTFGVETAGDAVRPFDTIQPDRLDGLGTNHGIIAS